MVYISHDILDCNHRPCRVTVVPPDPRELIVWMVLMVDKDDQEIKYVAVSTMFLVMLAALSLLCREL